MAFYLILHQIFFGLSLLIIFLLLLVDGGLGNSVQIPLAALGDATATLVLVVLEHTDLLQRLEHLTVNRAGGVDVVRGTVATVLGRAVDLTETVDTEGLAEVDVTSDGSGADVVPSLIRFSPLITRKRGWMDGYRTSRRPGEGAPLRSRS